jgi:hypothetical protein
MDLQRVRQAHRCGAEQPPACSGRVGVHIKPFPTGAAHGAWHCAHLRPNWVPLLCRLPIGPRQEECKQQAGIAKSVMELRVSTGQITVEGVRRGVRFTFSGG